MHNRQRCGAAAIVAGLAMAAAGPTAQPAASRHVLATVADAQNRLLADLDADDFVVAEDGQPRDVIAVYPADYPVVVLVDNSAGSRGDLEPIRAAVGGFLSRLGQRFVALGTLADPPALLTAVDAERADALKALEGLAASPAAAAMPIEAVAAAARAVRASGSPFAAIVVVSGQRIDAASPQSAPLLPEIVESDAIVHVVGRAGGRAAAPRLEADLLRDLADQTRGNFTAVFAAASYGPALNTLAERLGREVVVEYIVPPGPAPPGGVQVGVRIPGATVRGVRVSK